MSLILAILLQIFLYAAAKDYFKIDHILDVVGHCDRIIHFYQNLDDYNERLKPFQPIIFATRLWRNGGRIRSTWTVRTRCAIHVVYGPEKTNCVDLAVSVVWVFYVYPENEYYVVVTRAELLDFTPDGLT